MKTLTKCGCGMIGAYRTPWCSMLNSEEDKDILHLYYKLKWLQEEIEKRTSYLGKFRRTEEAKHLLDLIAMTKDEEDLFYPFAKAAMAEVFDALQLYIPQTHEKVYLWNEGKNTVEIESIPIVDVADCDVDEISQHLDVSTGTIYFYYETSLPQSIRDRISEFHILCQYDVQYEIAYAIFETGDEIKEIRTERVYVDNYNLASAEIVKPELSAAGEYTSAERITRLLSINLSAVILFYKEPMKFSAGDYVKLDNTLCIALADGDANDVELKRKLIETPDYRESIHYLIAFPYDKNVSLAEPLDTAVFEALVARIIFKWLQNAYPDEAPRYLEEYEEKLQQIRKRCSFFAATHIVNRIPRAF